MFSQCSLLKSHIGALAKMMILMQRKPFFYKHTSNVHDLKLLLQGLMCKLMLIIVILRLHRAFMENLQ